MIFVCCRALGNVKGGVGAASRMKYYLKQGLVSERYRVSSIGYLRLFPVKVSGIGYPIPKFKVSGIGISYRHQSCLKYQVFETQKKTQYLTPALNNKNINILK